MALFDFLKKKQKQEKTDMAREEKSAPVADVQKKEIERQTVAQGSVLVAPHVTERARDASLVGQYTFRIAERASKRDVKDSVEKMYGVHVERVRIIAGHEKPRRRGLTWGTKKGYKKAVVALRSGEAIDIF